MSYSDNHQWKTHVDLLKKTIKEVISNLSGDALSEAFSQSLVRAFTAVAKLLMEFCGLEAQLKHFHELEKRLLKASVDREPSKEYLMNQRVLEQTWKKRKL